MEKLQLFLSEGEEILYDSAVDLEIKKVAASAHQQLTRLARLLPLLDRQHRFSICQSLVELLSEIVIEEREKLEADQDSLQKLKVDVAESAQDLDLEPELMNEQRTQETIEAVISLLEYIMNDSEKDTSTQNDLGSPHQLKSNVPSEEGQGNQLMVEDPQLHKQLETALAKIREQQKVANEELCAAHEQCCSESSVISSGKTKSGMLLDACLEQLAMLRHLAKKT